MLAVQELFSPVNLQLPEQLQTRAEMLLLSDL
jgi:hypothetical protein